MTAHSLIKKLEKAIKNHGKRTLVTIDLKRVKELMKHEADGLSHWEAKFCETEFMPFRGEDGSMYRKDGTERMAVVVAIA